MDDLLAFAGILQFVSAAALFVFFAAAAGAGIVAPNLLYGAPCGGEGGIAAGCRGFRHLLAL